MSFINERRQQFLTEDSYRKTKLGTIESINLFKSQPSGIGDTLEDRWLYSKFIVANDTYNLLLLSYTAGESIDQLRYALENVIITYENYLQALVELSDDQNEMAFPIRSFVFS